MPHKSLLINCMYCCKSRVSCQKGPIWWGPFWQDTIEMCYSAAPYQTECYWVWNMALANLEGFRAHFDIHRSATLFFIDSDCGYRRIKMIGWVQHHVRVYSVMICARHIFHICMTTNDFNVKNRPWYWVRCQSCIASLQTGNRQASRNEVPGGLWDHVMKDCYPHGPKRLNVGWFSNVDMHWFVLSFNSTRHRWKIYTLINECLKQSFFSW